MIALIVIQIFLALISANVALAGNWHILGDEGRGLLFFVGPIREGDSRNLLQAYLTRSDVKTVIFDSPGGDLFEGIRLAETIERLSLNTMALETTSCESACAIAFMGGIHRVAEAGAALGIHAPYRIEDASQHSFLNAEGMVMRDFRNLQYRKIITELALRRGISKEFIDIMFIYDDPTTVKYIYSDEGLRMRIFTYIAK